MKILKNTLETEVGTWDDPGDYPSSAGSHPLPSRRFVEAVAGEVVVELDDDELRRYLADQAAEDDDLSWITDGIAAPIGVDEVIWQVDEQQGNQLVLSCRDFEPDPDWPGSDD